MDISLILNQTLKVADQYSKSLEALFASQGGVDNTRPETLIQMQHQLQNYLMAISFGSAISKSAKDLASSVINRL